MNTLEFFASVINSLAWPITWLIIVISLRSPLSQLLPTLQNFRYKDKDKDIQVSFREELQLAEQVAKVIDITPKPIQIESSEAQIETSRDSLKALAEASRFSNSFPESAVALAWGLIEFEIMSCITTLGISPDYPYDNSAYKNIKLLRQQGLLDANTEELLNRMRNLRNIAIHGGGGGPISRDDAREFIALTEGVIEKLREIHR